MNITEFKSELIVLGFKREKNTEYNNDVFTNESYGDGKLCIEVYVDSYNVRFVWKLGNGKRVGKCYYVHKEVSECKNVETMISQFVDDSIKMYGLKLA
jgi:hypothetical protein